jgi:hypothetical protein
METSVEIIDPKQYGLEETQATQIVSKLSQIVKERELLFANYEEVCKLEITHENIKKFKECRLAIANNRTKELEPARKADKEFFLRGGQFVDASYKREISENERREAKLKEAETHFERLEAQRIEELRQARILECQTVQEFIPFGIDLGLLNEEGYASILNGAKMQHEAKIKAEQEAEAARLKAEEEARIEREKEAQRIEAQRLENERLRKEAEEKEKALQLEREKAALEAERLRKESEAKLEAERKAAQAKLEAEQAEARRLAAELQAKKDVEIKAEQERIAAEEKARKEAEKLAKAPTKKQLSLWVDSFQLPQTNVENDLVKEITAKHEAFKNWAKSQIELL